MDDAPCSTSNEDILDQIFGKEDESHSSASSTTEEECVSDHEDIYGYNCGYNKENEDSYVDPSIRYLKDDVVEIFHGNKEGTFELLRLKNGVELEDKWRREVYKFTCIENGSDDSITSIEFSETENFSLYGTYNGHINVVKTSYDPADKLYVQKRVYTTENNYPICKVAYNQMDSGLVGCYYVNCDLQQEEIVILDLARQQNVEKSTVLAKYQTSERIWDVKWGWYDSGQLMVSSNNSLRILDLRDKGKCPKTLFLPYSCQLLAPCKFRDSLLAVSTENKGKSGVALFDVRKLACPLYEYDVHESAVENGISTLRWHPRDPFQLFYTARNSKYIGRLNTETCHLFSTPSVGQLHLDVSKTRHYNLSMETLWNLPDHEETFLTKLENLRNTNYLLSEEPIQMPSYLEQFEKAQADEKQEMPLIVTYPRYPRTNFTREEKEKPKDAALSEKSVGQEILEKESSKDLKELEDYVNKTMSAPYSAYKKRTEKQAAAMERVMSQKMMIENNEETKIIKNRPAPRSSQCAYKYLYIKENALILRQKVMDTCFGASVIIEESDKTAFAIPQKEEVVDDAERENYHQISFGTWVPRDVMEKLELDEEVKTALLALITPYFPEKHLISYETAKALSETIVSLLEQEYMKRCEIKESYGFEEDDNGFFGFWMTENIRAFTIPTAHLYGVVCLSARLENPLLYVSNTSPKIERLPSSYFQATLAKLRANDYYASTSFEVAEKTYQNLTRWVKPTLSLKHQDLVEILLQCREKKEDWLLWLNESVAFWERPFNSEFLENVHREYTGIWTELKKERAAKVKQAYAVVHQLQKDATMVPSQSEFSIYRGSDHRLKKIDQPVKGYNTKGVKHSVAKSFGKLLNEEVHNNPEEDDQDDGMRITFGSNGGTPSMGSIATTAGTTPKGTPQDKRDILTQFMNMDKRGSLTQTGTPEEASTTASGREISRPITIGAKGRKSGTYYALHTPKEQYNDDEGNSIKWLFGSTQSAGKEREIITPSGRSPRNVAEEKAVRKISMAGKVSSFTSVKNIKPETPRTLSLRKKTNGTPPSSQPSTSGSLGSYPLSGSADEDAAKTPVKADFPDIETPKKEQSFVTPESSREVSVEPAKKESSTPKWERKILEKKEKRPPKRNLRKLVDLTTLPPKTVEALARENQMTAKEESERMRRAIEKSYEDAKLQKAERAARKEAELQKQARTEEMLKAKTKKKKPVAEKKSKSSRKAKVNSGREAKSKKALTDMTTVSAKEQESQTEGLDNPKAIVPLVVPAHHDEDEYLKVSFLMKDPPIVEIEAPKIPEDQQLLKEQITGEVVEIVKPSSPQLIADSPYFETTENDDEAAPAPRKSRMYKYFEEYRAKEEKRKAEIAEVQLQEAKDVVPAEKPTISEADDLVGASLEFKEGLPSRPPSFLSQCSLDLSITPVVIQGRETTEDVMIVEMAKEATESPTLPRQVIVPPIVAPDPGREEFIPEDPTIREPSIVEPDPPEQTAEFELKRPKVPEPYTDENDIVIQREDLTHFEELDVEEPKKKMPKSILKPASKSTLQTLSKCNSLKTISSLDEQWHNAEEEEYNRNTRRPRKFGYDDMVAFLMQKKDYQAEKLIVSRRKWKVEYKELLTLREWDRLRIEARLDREEELERLAELKKKKESEMQARNLPTRLVQVDLGSSYASIPNTVIESSTVAKKRNVASAESVPERVERSRMRTEKTEDDGIEFVEEKKPLRKNELEDLIDMIPYRPRLNIFFALPLPANDAYEELMVDRIGYDFEIKGSPGLLQLIETEVNEEKPLGQMPWDTSLITHLQLFYGPYRERMLKSYCIANEDFADLLMESPRKEGEFYSCMYIALFQGRFNTFLELVEELYLFMFNMKEEVRDPDQIPENPIMTNRFLRRFIDICADFVDFTEVTRYNTELCPMERYKFENNVEEICAKFAGFLEKHVVLVPILMTLKQEVMEDGQPGDFYKLVMNLPNLPLSYKLLFLVRTTTTHTLYFALRKFFQATKGLDRLPYIGVGRHHDTLAVLAEHMAETNDFQEISHILLSSRAFEEDDWYHFILHEILAYRDPDLEKPLFIDAEYKTDDMPDELFKLPERPDTFSITNFENYSMDDPDHPLNKLVKLWKKETPGGAARLFAWLHENGRLPPTHHLDEVYPRFNIPSTLSMELLYDICKRAVYKYFDFLLTLDGKTKDYILEEVTTLGCETHRYENTSFLRRRMAILAGCRSLIPFYHATKIVPICQYCGVSREQGKVLRKKFDEEEQKKLEEKKGKKRKKDPDEVAIDPNFGANDVNGSMICPDAVAKAYPDVACPNCRKAMFRCSICHLQDKIDFAKLPKKPIGKKWSMCLRCHHGGHAHHLKLWFTKHDCCPVPGCECNCYRKLNSTDIKEWYTELVEVYGNPDNS